MELYDENIAHIIRDLLIGEISEEENQVLEAWLKESEKHIVLFEKIKKEICVSLEMPMFRTLDDEVAWQRFKIERRKRMKQHSIRRVLGYTAGIVLALVFISSFWFFREKEDAIFTASHVTSTIAPGGSRAILVSADGKIYELNEVQKPGEIEIVQGVSVKQNKGNLFYDSIPITRQAALVMNTLRIPRGGEFKLVLSDGTKVYLNSATELTYPVVFSAEERRVRLTGEAYFEVAKNVDKPFYVEVDGIEVKVYGTEFNVNTHRGKCIQTVLVNGKVGIKERGASDEIMMKPGELADFDKKIGKFRVEKVDIRRYVVWKDGYFTFENETLGQIMNTLSLWYDVDVAFQSESVKQFVFTGYMRRYNEIEEILDAITDVVGVKFVINGKNIVVSQ